MAIDYDKIQESPHLLDVLVQMEDVLDSFDLYVFKNWIVGEIVEGPKVRRYWFDFTLRYDMKHMPDPKGALRLIKHGVRVSYDKATLENDDGSEPDAPNYWEVKISIPRNLLSDMNAAELNFYDDEVEVEDVQDAQDEGMNDETGGFDETADDSNQADPEAAGEDEEQPDAPQF